MLVILLSIIKFKSNLIDTFRIAIKLKNAEQKKRQIKINKSTHKFAHCIKKSQKDIHTYIYIEKKRRKINTVIPTSNNEATQQERFR